MVDTLKKKPEGGGALEGLAQLGQVLQLFGVGQNKDSTTRTSLDPKGMDYLLQRITEGGYAETRSNKKRAGLYDSATDTLLANDFLARTAGEVAARNTVTTTTSGGGGFSDALDSFLGDGDDFERAGKGAGTAVGYAIGNYFGGPIGGAIGSQIGGFIGEKGGDAVGDVVHGVGRLGRNIVKEPVRFFKKIF